MQNQLIDKINICKTCLNSQFEFSRGIYCSLTNEKPEFEKDCSLFKKKQTDKKPSQQTIKKTEKHIYKDKKNALLLLIIFEFILTFIFDAIWGFSKDFSFMLFFIVIPLSLIINISIAILLLFIKKGYSWIFILNAIITTVMFYIWLHFF